MSSRIEAGRLSHVDLGKTIEVPGHPPRPLSFLSHGRAIGVRLYLRGDGVKELVVTLDPHTIVTITGKGQP